MSSKFNAFFNALELSRAHTLHAHGAAFAAAILCMQNTAAAAAHVH